MSCRVLQEVGSGGFAAREVRVLGDEDDELGAALQVADLPWDSVRSESTEGSGGAGAGV